MIQTLRRNIPSLQEWAHTFWIGFEYRSRRRRRRHHHHHRPIRPKNLCEIVKCMCAKLNWHRRPRQHSITKCDQAKIPKITNEFKFGCDIVIFVLTEWAMTTSLYCMMRFGRRLRLICSLYFILALFFFWKNGVKMKEREITRKLCQTHDNPVDLDKLKGMTKNWTHTHIHTQAHS